MTPTSRHDPARVFLKFRHFNVRGRTTWAITDVARSRRINSLIRSFPAHTLLNVGATEVISSSRSLSLSTLESYLITHFPSFALSEFFLLSAGDIPNDD